MRPPKSESSLSGPSSRRDFIKRASLAGIIVASSAVSQDLSGDSDSQGDETIGNGNPRANLAVVELFTSQGCSSCPPADHVLADLVNRHQQENYPVLGLSFHVDYWNYLGWEDPFSSPKWSARQRNYAAVLKDRVYTPQMFVNGQDGFVGSRRKQLDALLSKQLERDPEHSVTLATKLNSDRAVQIRFGVTGDIESRILNIALVTRSLTAKVIRGENAGRTLTHANVVRQLVINRLEEAYGELTLDLPTDENSEHSVIGYVQHVKEAVITAATEARLSFS